MTGKELKERRESLGISQQKLADRLDVAVSTIARQEQLKDKEISTSRLYELALDMIAESQFIAQNEDGFDIKANIEMTDDAASTIRNWYEFQGKEAPWDMAAIFFQGWDSFTMNQKIEAVIDWKKALDRTIWPKGKNQ